MRNLELAPTRGRARIRVKGAARWGSNFIDVYYRTGLYPTPQSPFVPGSDGGGMVGRSALA